MIIRLELKIYKYFISSLIQILKAGKSSFSMEINYQQSWGILLTNAVEIKGEGRIGGVLTQRDLVPTVAEPLHLKDGKANNLESLRGEKGK